MTSSPAPGTSAAATSLEERFRLAAQALQGYVYDWDVASRRIERTEGFERIFGRPSPDVSADEWMAWIHAPDRAATRRAFEAAQRDGTPMLHLEYCVHAPGAGAVWVADHMRLVYGGDGRVARIVGTVLDVSERKRIEARLRESESRFRAIFEQTNDYVFTADLEQRITSCNPAVAAAVGLPAERLVGRSIAEFVSPDGFARTSSMLAQKVRHGGTTHYEIEVRMRDGRAMVWDVNSRLTLGPDGRPNGLHAIARDVTERRRLDQERRQLLEAERAARSEAEAANRLKDEFLATLSHELRTPLSNVVSWARLLQKKFAHQDPFLARGLEVIVDNGLAQSQMIADLLDMSRVISGKVQLDLQPVDLGPLVERIVGAQRPDAETRGLALTYLAPAAPLVARVDAPRLQQVLWNLLSNAFKFTPAGGRVQVRLRRHEQRAALSVIDSGAGIEPAFLPRVFDRFRQAEGGAARRYGGLGLGLAIVKQLAELHGGEVHAASDGPGHGATFTLELPLADGAEVQPVENSGVWKMDARDGDASALAGVRVLAVEDQAVMRELMTRVLQEQGAEVVAVADASQALAALAQRSFDVLVSDLGLPQVDGFALVRRLRAAPDTESLPAIAVTAFARSEDRRRALDAGFQDYLTKPYEVGRLIAAVARQARRGTARG